MKSQNELSEIASQFGKMGGKAFVKKYGKDKMKELGKKGAQVRWPKGRKQKQIK